jgi:hypothetical protein
MVQTPPRPTPQLISPLENGDRLSRGELERRYAAMPENCKAERIEGIVYMAAALRFKSHGLPHSYLNSWITTYSAFTPCTFVADAPSVHMNEDNVVRTARGSAEPVRLLLIGSREGLRETIDHLCVLSFCDHAK